MIDSFDTRTMLAALDQVKPPKTFLRDTFFRDEEYSMSRHVDIDIIKGSQRLAPFVRPRGEPRRVDRRGFARHSFEPPCIKMEMETDAVSLLMRLPGETIYQTGASPQLIAAQQLGRDLDELRNLIIRRIEWMCAKALLDGKIPIKDDESGLDLEIDFLMPATHIIDLTATVPWTDVANSNPERDLREWQDLISDDSGQFADIAVFGKDVLTAFLEHEKVQKLLDNRRVVIGEIAIQPLQEQKARYIGSLEGIDIFTYSEIFLNPDTGTKERMVPSDRIFLGSSGARTAVHFGMIIDTRAPARVPFFPKMYYDERRGCDIVQIQSSPLVALHESNAFVSVKAV